MQDYNPIQPTGLISADRAKINNNIESVMSHFSGIAFPTTNLYEGMYCWRSDLKKMYQLNADLVNWTLINDMSQGYSSVAHSNRADYAVMDEDGNKLKDTYYKQASLDDLKKALFPIGSVYITMTNTNPSTFLGGTWQQIAGGRTLIGASASYVAGSMGGSETHTLKVENLPAHNHSASVTINASGNHYHTGSTSTNGNHTHSCLASSGDSGGGGFTDGDDRNNTLYTNAAGDHSHSFTTSTNGSHNHTGTVAVGNTGNGTAVSNMQPYLVCYFWQKVAD